MIGRAEPTALARAEPAAGTVEAWAFDYVTSVELEHKFAPPPPPTDRWLAGEPTTLRIAAPGRPSRFASIEKSKRSLTRAQLAHPRKRAQLLHTFCHHELQAAELMCWAILAFPATPPSFRRGLLGICLDEIRHMGMYRRHIEALGFAIGDFPVRDWFWGRVAACATPLQFVALLGIGFEGGNLDHTRRFAEWFEAAGDVDGAELQRVVGDEEVAHVRFAIRWFREWAPAGLDFDAWRAALVPPLTPSLLKGSELDLERRKIAGFTDEFLASLAQWQSV